MASSPIPTSSSSDLGQDPVTSPMTNLPFLAQTPLTKTLQSLQTTLTSPSPELDYYTRFISSLALGGFFAGFYKGFTTRSVQFLAENAHRLPRTVAGWYFYHREKNYTSALAGFGKGVTRARQFGALAVGFSAVEHVSEKYIIKQESYLNTLLGWWTVSGAFVGIRRLGLQYAKYVFLFSTSAALLMGGIQDGYGAYYGMSMKYPSRERKDVSLWPV